MSVTSKNESPIPEIMDILEQRLSYVRRKNSTDKKPESAPVVIRMGNGNSTIRDAVENVALIREKQRHQKTRRLVNIAETRIEYLQKELDEKNSDIEGFRERARDLTRQLDTANMTIEDLEKEVEELSQADAKAAAQEERIKDLELRLKDGTDGRRKAEMEAIQSKEALHGVELSKEELNQKFLAALASLDERDDQIAILTNTKELLEKREKERESTLEDLRTQVAAANKAITIKNEALRAAEEENITLRTSLFDTRHNLEEATAVIGEASLSFNQEVSKFMNVLQTTRNSIAVPSLSKAG